METKKPRVLVVGASGMLGAKIVRELVALGTADVRVTHRASSKHDNVVALRALGVELVIADLADAASLAHACTGVDVVVSSVQGGHDVVVGGQTRLLRAAEQAGVRCMIPSDYSLDFFKTVPGGNRNLDERREMNAVLDASTAVRGTSVLCGAFMDLLGWGHIGPDRTTGVYKVWGDADQPYDFTHTDDVAKYIAAVALDPEAGRVVRVAGETISPRELGAVFAHVRGTPVTIEAAGSIEELDQRIAAMRAADEAPDKVFPPWQQMQYARDLASGLGRLAPLDNARYPLVRPRSVRDVIA